MRGRKRRSAFNPDGTLANVSAGILLEDIERLKALLLMDEMLCFLLDRRRKGCTENHGQTG